MSGKKIIEGLKEAIAYADGNDIEARGFKIGDLVMHKQCAHWAKPRTIVATTQTKIAVLRGEYDDRGWYMRTGYVWYNRKDIITPEEFRALNDMGEGVDVTPP